MNRLGLPAAATALANGGKEFLLVADGTNVKVGKPTVASAAVVATVQGNEKGKKLIVFKYRRRKGYRRKNGHRQEYTAVRIDEING